MIHSNLRRMQLGMLAVVSICFEWMSLFFQAFPVEAQDQYATLQDGQRGIYGHCDTWTMDLTGWQS